MCKCAIGDIYLYPYFLCTIFITVHYYHITKMIETHFKVIFIYSWHFPTSFKLCLYLFLLLAKFSKHILTSWPYFYCCVKLYHWVTWNDLFLVSGRQSSEEGICPWPIPSRLYGPLSLPGASPERRAELLTLTQPGFVDLWSPFLHQPDSTVDIRIPTHVCPPSRSTSVFHSLLFLPCLCPPSGTGAVKILCS